MKRALLLMSSVLLGFTAYAAPASAVAGKWACTSDGGSGELSWNLAVKADGGKLAGSLFGGPERPGEIPLIDPKLDGNTFTFKIYVNANCTAEAKLKVDGKKLEGTFGCPEASGSFKGTRQ